MKFLKITHPFVIAPMVLVFFAIGFGGGLLQIGYFDPIYVEENSEENGSTEERIQAELSKLRQLTLDLDMRGADLKKRAEALRDRELQLAKAESDLELQKASLNDVKQEIDAMRKQLDSRLVLVDSNQEAGFQHLAKLYTSMTPENAAKILATLPEPQAVQILKKMKEPTAAKILEVWASGDELLIAKASRITTLLRVTIKPEATE